ncbi:MAG: hypothetical protein JSV90_06830 [Methanobacteriota archaeon]|nr:MAG: hypothetical protein JSV90_06830 [Euryarchaeota archaeon]
MSAKKDHKGGERFGAGVCGFMKPSKWMRTLLAGFSFAMFVYGVWLLLSGVVIMSGYLELNADEEAPTWIVLFYSGAFRVVLGVIMMLIGFIMAFRPKRSFLLKTIIKEGKKV